MKNRAGDYLILDKAAGVYRENPEQAVRDDVEKHYWLHVGRTIMKDWRLYLMLVPMLLVFLFWRYFPMYELQFLDVHAEHLPAQLLRPVLRFPHAHHPGPVL